jgi:hypothetical protein
MRDRLARSGLRLSIKRAEGAQTDVAPGYFVLNVFDAGIHCRPVFGG